MKRLVYISHIASPHQVKFCYTLQEYFEAEFWFYEHLSYERASWWRVDLGDKCKVLDRVLFRSTSLLQARYLALSLSRALEQFDPDIVMLGGFSVPSNYLAYRWAKARGKKVIVFAERSRDRKGVLRQWSPLWRLLRYLYRDIDLMMTSADDAVPQYRDEFRFGDKVVAGRYSADLEVYLDHPLRGPKPAYTYLFANRMTELYNPIRAIEIFATVLARYPGSRLLMNAADEMRGQCKARIADLGITDAVEFLIDIKSWDDLHKVYARSDMLLLPANFSNGNFTILEAMASGMGIVISNKVLGIGKLIEDGVNGFNCEPAVEDFVNRIDRYIHEPALFEKHAMINRSMVQPLSTKGTARFFAELIHERLGI
jgi:glycosyltransferase involved in cell wall biosynthesis